jgi:hypothetical protein
LPGHVKKYCWTYPEEDISDKPCDICEGRHGASPCYFDPEMYNKYHEGQPPRELYLRRAEETRQVVIDKIGSRGEIYHKKVYPPGGYYPWKGREYMGPNGLIKIPVPFLFGPRRAWRSFSDPKRVPVQKTASNTYPIPIPEKKNLWYFRLEKPPYLKFRNKRGTKSNPSVNSENGSGKSAPHSRRKNKQQRPNQNRIGTDKRQGQRQDVKEPSPISDSGPKMRERNWWETPVGSNCDTDLISGKNSPKPKKQEHSL